MSDFIRIPPDSTGKRIRHNERLRIILTSENIPNLNSADKGDTVTGDTSGTTATFIGYDVELGTTYLYVVNASGTFTNTETVSITGIGTLGTVASSVDVYIPVVNVADGDTPRNLQKVDDIGQAFVRFGEGAISFDAFSHAQFTHPQIKDVHSFVYGDEGGGLRYGDVTATGGSITATPTSSEIIFSTNTTSGSIAQRTTNQYYPYTPGVGTELLFSMKVGDTGKTNVVRRWGFFDDLNGMYFEVSGSTFSVNLRSSTTGTVVTEKVLQSQMNGDKLEDAASDSYVLDISKYNLYWIDFQWLGVGKVRFGTYGESGKVVMHTFLNPNTKTHPYTQTGTLPLRWEQFNIGTAGSTSEMGVVCAAVINQAIDFETGYKGQTYSTISNSVAVSGSLVPLVTVQPSSTVEGKPNRHTYFATDFEWIIQGDPVVLETYINADITGSTFTAPTGSGQSLRVDVDATEINGGFFKDRVTLNSGAGNYGITENLTNSIGNFADGTSPTVSFAAKTIHPGQTANVALIVRWKEVH